MRKRRRRLAENVLRRSGREPCGSDVLLRLRQRSVVVAATPCGVVVVRYHAAGRTLLHARIRHGASQRESKTAMSRLIQSLASVAGLATRGVLYAVAGMAYGAYGGLIVVTFVASVLINDKRREARSR